MLTIPSSYKEEVIAMKSKVIRVLVSVIALLFVQHVHAQSFHDVILFKMTAETERGFFQWEFNNPDHFEYHEKERVIHGERAQKEVTTMYEKMALHPKKRKEELARVLKDNGYGDLLRLDIRWQTADSELHTWLWKK